MVVTKLLFSAQNPPENDGLNDICPVCLTCIHGVDGTTTPVVANSNVTSIEIRGAVPNATYNVTVTYQAADGCEASSDISVGKCTLKDLCTLDYRNITID